MNIWKCHFGCGARLALTEEEVLIPTCWKCGRYAPWRFVGVVKFTRRSNPYWPMCRKGGREE